VGFDRGIDIGESTDRARDRAGRDFGSRRGQSRAVAGELGKVAGELQPKGGGLGMDAMAAADTDGVLVPSPK